MITLGDTVKVMRGEHGEREQDITEHNHGLPHK